MRSTGGAMAVVVLGTGVVVPLLPPVLLHSAGTDTRERSERRREPVLWAQPISTPWDNCLSDGVVSLVAGFIAATAALMVIAVVFAPAILRAEVGAESGSQFRPEWN